MIRTISAMAEDVENGNESPFEALANLKTLEKDLKDAISYVMEFAVAEGSKYEKTFIKGDHQFTLVNGRRNFNFKNIKNWSDKKAELKAIEDLHKTAWQQYQNGINAITQDGEILQMPEVTYSKDSISVKLFSNLIKK